MAKRSGPSKGSILLFGVDRLGRVRIENGRVIRELSPEATDIPEIYREYRRHKLERFGLIASQYDRLAHVIIHPLLPISYPHEWSASMFLDSVIFQLKLLRQLAQYGLTLKDILPQNVLFDYHQPVFVDFSSLVKNKMLTDEKWLYDDITKHFADLRFLVLHQMLSPYNLVPLLAYAMGQFDLGRTILRDKGCNMGHGRPNYLDVIRVTDLLQPSRLRQLIQFRLVQYHPHHDYNSYLDRLLQFTEQLALPITNSAYLDYYQQKNEDFNFKPNSHWGNKQTNTYRVLKELKPSTVLDIGANTGWFSTLAAQLGSRVIATDIDHTLISSLYHAAKSSDLPILPLVLTFDDLTDAKINQIYLPASVRLACQLVLCLGLFHHLVLGLGEQPEKVISRLAALAQDALLLEFINLQDPKIQSEPSFFPNLDKFTDSNYNLEQIKKIGLKYFKDVSIMPSHPDTRQLVLFIGRKK